MHDPGGRSRTGGWKAPEGLSAERLSTAADDFVLFTWPTRKSETPPELDELSAAEIDVLRRVVGGASNAQIARARGTAARTIANQVASLLRKLGAASRLELTRRYGQIA